MKKTTRYIDLKTVANFLKEKGVANVIEDLVSYVESDFARFEEFQKMPRTAHHSPVGVCELMPIGDDNIYTFKYVNGHPENPKKNFLTVMGVGLLADVKTGYPLLFSEMTLLTAIRTAATSVLAAKYLAKKNPKKMALIGNGSQSEFQALGFNRCLGIEEIHCYDVDEKATEKLMKNLENVEGLKLIKYDSVKEACKGCDIITTVTADKKLATILTADMIEEGMHLNAVGGDCPGKTELESKILFMGNVYVEFEEQSRIEGEIQHMAKDFKVTHISDVIKAGGLKERKETDITIFDSVGFAVEDYAMLRYLYEVAEKEDIGEKVILIPEIENPKDLFGLTK
ncbi:MAG: ornithine cyclodeaminase [Fusobacterium sp.]|nr:ornithine cyclodeaminase [Fusobacterium sp.]